MATNITVPYELLTNSRYFCIFLHKYIYTDISMISILKNKISEILNVNEENIEFFENTLSFNINIECMEHTYPNIEKVKDVFLNFFYDECVRIRILDIINQIKNDSSKTNAELANKSLEVFNNITSNIIYTIFNVYGTYGGFFTIKL